VSFTQSFVKICEIVQEIEGVTLTDKIFISKTKFALKKKKEIWAQWTLKVTE
jgi:hypothetical protein